jgi:hypothetical protein
VDDGDRRVSLRTIAVAQGSGHVVRQVLSTPMGLMATGTTPPSGGRIQALRRTPVATGEDTAHTGVSRADRR